MNFKKKLVRGITLVWGMLCLISLARAQSTVDITAASDDGYVSDPSIITENNPYIYGFMKVGKSAVTGDPHLTSAIIPFEIPEIPEGSEITDASLKVYVSFGREWTNCNVDLYGLSFQSSSTISSDDYFSGVFGTGNGFDFGIEDDFFAKNVDLGNLDTERFEETSEAANELLVSYIKSQLTAGAQPGDFLFLRLSVDLPDMTGYHYFKVEDADSEKPAVLSLTYQSSSNVAPVLSAIEDQVMEVGESLSLSFSASDSNGDALSFSITENLPPGATFTDHNNGTATLDVSEIQNVAEYNDIVVTVSDGELTDSDSFSIIVNEAEPNIAPVLQAVGDQSVSKYGYLQVALTATDQDGDDLTFSVSDNLPPTAYLVDNGDGTAYIELVSAGDPATYSDIMISVSDGDLTATETIVITIDPIDPNQLMNLDSPTQSRFTITDKVWPSNHGEADVCLWANDKVGVATITIDDNIEADHSWWLSMQAKYPSLKFTWFVIENGVSSWDKYQTLASAGHEVQGHDDCDINDGSDIGYRLALQSIKDQINQNISKPALTYAYPCGKEDKVNIARDIFIGMRGVFGVMNKADQIDYLALNSRSATNDNHDIDVLLNPNELLFNTSYYRGWYSAHYHTVSDKTAVESHLNYIDSKSEDVWIAGYSEATQYGQERDSHTLTVDEVTDLMVKFTLTDMMSDTYFDRALTVKLRVNNDWLSAKSTQSGERIESTIIEYEGNKYMLIEVVPDRGEVIVQGSLSANNAPTLDPISDQSLSEIESATVNLSASDPEGDFLVFSASDNLPLYATLVDHENGTATLTIDPSIGDAGTVDDIVVTVSDGELEDSQSFSIDVTAFSGAAYYCDPVNGDNANEGSKENPWGSFSSVLSAAKSINDGGVIYLLDGDHGAVRLISKTFSNATTVKALPEHAPVFTELVITNSTNWTFEGIAIDGTNSTKTTSQFLVTGDANTTNITFKNCLIQSAEESSGWTKDDWYANAIGGMDMRGSDIVVENCLIKNTYHAMSLRGDRSRATNNVIDNFAGDGIRGLGNASVFEYNTVRDCYVEDYETNHDDAFQTFITTDDPKSEGMIIRFNKILLFDDPITQFVIDNDLIGYSMQGIIITDGYPDGWVVENNLLVTNHWHGISLYGARNSRIQNNTVVKHPYFTDTETLPWILVDDNTKTGQTNFSNTIRNNLCVNLVGEKIDDTSVEEGNVTISPASSSRYDEFFVDYADGNYQLKEGSTAIDAGVNSDLTDYDLAGNLRVVNGTVDAGAYEFFEENVPVIAPIEPQGMTVGQTLDLLVTATDPSSLSLELTVANLPDFGTFQDNEDGTASISFLPAEGDEGTYNDITVTADNGEFAATEMFTLNVEALDINEPPVLNGISDQTIDEGTEATITFNASDADNDDLSFTMTGAPDFVSLVDNTDGNASLVMKPAVGDHGTYSDIKIEVSDGEDVASRSFSIVVNKVLSVNQTGSTFKLFPNPVRQDFLFLQVPEAFDQFQMNLDVVNMAGSHIGVKYIKTSGGTREYKVTLPAGLASGHYLMIISDDKQSVTKRLFINR
ncbi:MAG: choice-of-anchor Q domain-containing protein [Cyclobacteriaceae bacterium]